VFRLMDVLRPTRYLVRLWRSLAAHGRPEEMRRRPTRLLRRFQRQFRGTLREGGAPLSVLWTTRAREPRGLRRGVVVCSRRPAILFDNDHPFLGRNFFPTSTQPEDHLHIRGSDGVRWRTRRRSSTHIEEAVREVIHEKEIGSLVDNVGCRSRPSQTTPTRGYLAPATRRTGHYCCHPPTTVAIRRTHCRHNLCQCAALPREFPVRCFGFMTADIGARF